MLPYLVDEVTLVIAAQQEELEIVAHLVPAHTRRVRHLTRRGSRDEKKNRLEALQPAVDVVAEEEVALRGRKAALQTHATRLTSNASRSRSPLRTGAAGRCTARADRRRHSQAL